MIAAASNALDQSMAVDQGVEAEAFGTGVAVVTTEMGPDAALLRT